MGPLEHLLESPQCGTVFGLETITLTMGRLGLMKKASTERKRELNWPFTL